MNRIENLLHEAQLEGISLDSTSLEFSFRRAVERLAEKFSENYEDISTLQELESAVQLLRRLPFEVNLWKVENICYEMLQTSYREFQTRADRGDEEARAWVHGFSSIAESLALRV